jgi:hypothetical protein
MGRSTEEGEPGSLNYVVSAFVWAGGRKGRQMSTRKFERATAETGEMEAGGEDVSRRRFLGQLALAGVGAAGLALLAQEAQAAPPPTEHILGNYDLNMSYRSSEMIIESQSGPTFIGRFADGTALQGTIAGAQPNPVTICFTRRTPDGSMQIFTGSAATRSRGINEEALLTGVYYHNGAGPFPWVANGVIRR